MPPDADIAEHPDQLYAERVEQAVQQQHDEKDDVDILRARRNDLIDRTVRVVAAI